MVGKPDDGRRRSQHRSRNLLAEEIGAPELIDQLTADQSRHMTAIQIKIVQASTRGIYTSMAGAFLLTAVASSQLQAGGAVVLCWLWWALLTAGLAHSAYSTARASHVRMNVDETLRFADRGVAISGYYTGTLWGASAWVMLPTRSPEFQLFLMVFMAIVMMAIAGALAVYRPLLRAALIPLAVVFALGLLRLGGLFNSVMAVGFGLFAYTILEYTKVQEQGVKAAIALRMKAESLVAELTAQQELTTRALKEAERAKEAAEIANQGKTTFLAAAGHDLRQPMHALVQYFAHLERRNQDATLVETIARMGKSLDAMQDLLDSILEVSRLLMGSVRPTVRRFPISQVLDRLDAQLRPIAEDKGLHFLVESDATHVETDEVLLERILRNLGVNGIRYTDQGRVLIRCRRVVGSLQVQVWDTGIGIPQDEQGKIFEPFYQVANEARDRRKGLGLGLALVRQLCELLQIRLRLRSVVGRGSVFMVDVPLASASPSTVSEPKDTPAERDFARGAFVVLIDDNDASLEATSETLRTFGCRVLSAHSGLEAIALLQGQEFMPHLVISDYRLEHGETAIGAIRMVTENQRALFGDGFDIPALVVSGDTGPSELEAVRRAGYSMLHKPLKPALLYAAVNGTLAELAKAANH